MPCDQWSLIHLEAWFPPCFARKIQQTTIFVWQILTISKLKISNLRPFLSLTFPQGFGISKKLKDCISGSGCKKTFKLYLKK